MVELCSHCVAQAALKLIVLPSPLFSAEVTGTYYRDLLDKLTLTCSPKMSQRLVISLLKWPSDPFEAIIHFFLSRLILPLAFFNNSPNVHEIMFIVI